MKQQKYITYFLAAFIPVLLLLNTSSCDSCNPTNDGDNEDGYVAYQDFDTTAIYDIEGMDMDQPNLEVMYTRVPGDPDTGIVVRRLLDSGTHHERTIKGKVLRGTYRVDSPTISQDFIYAHYESDSGCSESHWYSWVNPTIEYGPFGGRLRSKNETRGFSAITGLPFRFGTWNKDYQKKWVDSTNRSRVRAGGRPFPVISPNDSLRDGQPYMPFPTPEGTGFLDAPNFTRRLPGNNRASMAEQLFGEYAHVPRCVENNRRAPAADSGIIRFTTRGITYLYCIAPRKECIGYFTWTTVETDTIIVNWVRGTARDCGEAAPAGITGKIWVPRTTFRSGMRATVGPWMSCE